MIYFLFSMNKVALFTWNYLLIKSSIVIMKMGKIKMEDSYLLAMSELFSCLIFIFTCRLRKCSSIFCVYHNVLFKVYIMYLFYSKLHRIQLRWYFHLTKGGLFHAILDILLIGRIEWNLNFVCWNENSIQILKK